MPMYARTVDTNITELAPYNERRKSLVIFNNGAGRIFVSQDEANILTTGFPLDVGGSLGFVAIEGDEPALRWFAQASAGSHDVRVVEGYGKE